MTLLLKLAWRNLWRQKRRSLITLSAVVFAIFLSVVQRSFQRGVYEYNMKHSMRISTGFLQIHHKEYLETPTLRKSFTPDDALFAQLPKLPGFTGYSQRIETFGLLSVKDNSFGAAIIGIEPARDTVVTDYYKRINAGRFIADGEGVELNVGYRLLENLGVSIGDSIVVLTQTYDGFLTSFFAVIVGTLKTGLIEADRTLIFTNLSALQSHLGMEGMVSMISVSLDDLNKIEAATEIANNMLPPGKLKAFTWYDANQEFMQFMEFDNVSNDIFMYLLFFVVGFGILNTIIMSVTERYREFGILLSIGMKNRTLILVVAIEIAILAIAGILAGNLLAAPVNYYLIVNPIEFGGEFAEYYSEYGFLPVLTSTMRISLFLSTNLFFLALIAILSVYPLRKVNRLEPLKGIRHT